MSREASTLYLLTRTLHNRVLSQELIASAQRVVNRGQDLCQMVHDRRRHPDYFYHLARYVRTHPRMRRFLPLCGGDYDSLRIETEERPEAMVARVSGEVDVANVNRFKEAMEPALHNCRNIILDITNLRYIDSTGLHALIDAQKVLRENKCLMIVAGASPGIAKVMGIIRLGMLMRLVSTVGEAIDFLRPEAPAAASDG